VLEPGTRVTLPRSVHDDLFEALARLESESGIDLKQFRISTVSMHELVEELRRVFGL